MHQIKRRQFLQFAGSTLATLGLSQLDIFRAGDRYARVLAQDTPRKLALLIGINTYKQAPLQGCVNDVYLQQQLLIHRFGFNPQDILIVTDEQATRQGMLTAFEEHLIKQAKPGDVVVYHFSGHGSRVSDPECDFDDCLNSTFVPVDGSLPTGFPNQGGTVQDIMGHTLFLLMDALQTENVSVVLDSCHSGGGTRGNFTVRSRNGGSLLQPTDAELAYQQQWLQKLNLSPEEFKRRRREGVAKGVVIASTQREQEAADAPFSDFFAGAFTYFLTQYLWQQSSNQSFSAAIPNISRSTTKQSFTGQVPQIEAKPGTNHLQSPVYFISQQTPPAEAVITKIEGNQAQLWLGGLNPQSIAGFEAGSILSIVDPQSQEKGRVQLISREGLVGKAKLLDRAQPGAFLQERARSVPSNLTLKIGLDPSLGNNTSQARQALQGIQRIEALPLQQQEVHYIFGVMTDAYRQQLLRTSSQLPEVGSLGLFSPALELVPDSFGSQGETVSAAITRLLPKLRSLLAARIVKTTLNTNSSRLNVLASIHREGAGKIIANSFTVRGSSPTNQPANISPSSQQLPLGSGLQLQVTNKETSNLYLSILVIDPTGEISVIFPNQWAAGEEVTLVKAGQTLKIPDPSQDSFRLIVQEPKGIVEVLVLASRTPLREAMLALQALAAESKQRSGPVNLNQPAEVIDNLLNDINNGSRGSGGNIASSNPNSRSIDTTQLAALSITFEVV